MTYYGGTVEGITTFVVGAPQFTIGEKSLLFLETKYSEKPEQIYYVISGFSQGKFNICIDSETKKEKVERDQSKIPLKLEQNGNSIFQTENQSILLENFLNYVINYVE